MKAGKRPTPRRFAHILCPWILTVLPILTGCPSSKVVTPDPSVLCQDEFTSPPAAPWTWIRENPQAHKIDGGLQIKIEPGGLMGGGKDAKNILIRPLPAEAKSVSVSVDTDHKSQYEQAGLNLYRGDDDYIKLAPAPFRRLLQCHRQKGRQLPAV